MKTTIFFIFFMVFYENNKWYYWYYLIYNIRIKQFNLSCNLVTQNVYKQYAFEIDA